MSHYRLGDRRTKVGAKIRTWGNANPTMMKLIAEHPLTQDVVPPAGLPRVPLFIIVDRYNPKLGTIVISACYLLNIEGSKEIRVHIEVPYDETLCCEADFL